MNIQQIDELMQNAGTTNETIFNSFAKANSVINHPKYKKVMVSISGGSDSDIVLDICNKIYEGDNIIYVWFDTGLEFQATKNHLDYLEQKYGIEIIRERAIKTIPVSVREYGQPFLSKYVSEMLARLQRHNFKFENRPFDELIKEYPNCKGALKWWCSVRGGEGLFDITRNKYLKEFLIENPPTFKVSNKCCDYAKKNVAKHLLKKYGADLNIVGVRKAEGGIRATAYTNCFDDNSERGEVSNYRPIFYYTNQDKEEYEKAFGVVHSACYNEYGMLRTGCAGCPFSRQLWDDNEIIGRFEPKLFKAINNIFKDTYEYTKKYHKFCEIKRQKDRDDGQTTVYDFFIKEDAND